MEGEHMDLEDAEQRLDFAGDAAEVLQVSLGRQHRDVLALWSAVDQIGAPGSPMAEAVVDAAAAISQATSVNREEHVPQIRRALRVTDAALGDAVETGRISRESARPIEHLVAVNGQELRHIDTDLDNACVALRPLAASSPDSPDIATIARRSADEARGSLELARRSAFRITEDLPEIKRGVQGLDAAADQQIGGGDDVPVVAPRVKGAAVAMRQPPGSAVSRTPAVGY